MARTDASNSEECITTDINAKYLVIHLPCTEFIAGMVSMKGFCIHCEYSFIPQLARQGVPQDPPITTETRISTKLIQTIVHHAMPMTLWLEMRFQSRVFEAHQLQLVPDIVRGARKKKQ